MRTLLFLSAFICAVSAFAQKPPIKFGDVTKEELLMTTYDKDTSASAVILADYGFSSIVYRESLGFSLDFERTTRIKILTKDGLKWGDFIIPLYVSGSDDEKIGTLKAATYNLQDGKIVESKVKNDGIFKEKVDENTIHMKVTCPNVKEGSVVEITYRMNSPFLFNFQDWYFQSTIPIVMSEYRANIPEYFNYDKYLQGYVSLAVATESREPTKIRSAYNTQAGAGEVDLMETRARWVARDVPAFKPEPYMTAVHDFISKLNFELASIKFPNQPIKTFLGDWKDINKTMWESDAFGRQVTSNGFLKNTVEQLIANVSSPEEKIIAITNYVKANVAWDGMQRRSISDPLRKVLDNKKGSSAEINLLLASMLEKANIKVSPVLLSTRDHGLLREATPALGQFNYVICLAEYGDKSILLDATEKLLPIGMLPERCLNGKGFVVGKEGFKWVPLNAPMKTRSTTSAELTLTESDNLKGKLKVDCNGYAALRHRKRYFTDGEIEFLKQFVGSRAWEIQNTSISNAEKIHENFVQEHEVIVNENTMVAGDMVYIDPFITSSQKQNPFKSEVRQYPVDFGSPMEETFHLKLELPANYTVDELPQSKVIALPENAGRYMYNVAQNGNVITVTSMFQINKSLFTQLEYPYLREFYNQIVAKQAEQIVLKKKM